MKSSRQRNMGWGFSLVILCVTIILAPRSYAHKAGHNTGEYGTVIGIVGSALIIDFDFSSFYLDLESTRLTLNLLGHR